MFLGQEPTEINQATTPMLYVEGKEIPEIKNKLELLEKQLKGLGEFKGKTTINEKIAVMQSDEAFSNFFMGMATYSNILPPTGDDLIDNFLLLLTTSTKEYVWKMWDKQKDNLKLAIQLSKDKNKRISFLEKMVKLTGFNMHSEIFAWYPMLFIMEQRDEFEKSDILADKKVGMALTAYIQKWTEKKPNQSNEPSNVVSTSIEPLNLPISQPSLSDIPESKREVDDVQYLSTNKNTAWLVKDVEIVQKPTTRHVAEIQPKRQYKNMAFFQNLNNSKPIQTANPTPYTTLPPQLAPKRRTVIKNPNVLNNNELLQYQAVLNQRKTPIEYSEGKKNKFINYKLELLSRKLRGIQEFSGMRTITDRLVAIESDIAFSNFFMGMTTYNNVLPPKGEDLIDNFLLLVTSNTVKYYYYMWDKQQENLKIAIETSQDESMKSYFLEKVIKGTPPDFYKQILPWFDISFLIAEKARFESSQAYTDVKMVNALNLYIQEKMILDNKTNELMDEVFSTFQRSAMDITEANHEVSYIQPLDMGLPNTQENVGSESETNSVIFDSSIKQSMFQTSQLNLHDHFNLGLDDLAEDLQNGKIDSWSNKRDRIEEGENDFDRVDNSPKKRK